MSKNIKDIDNSIKMELNDFTCICVQAYMNSDYENIESILRKYRKKKRKVAMEIKSLEDLNDKTMVYKGQFVQTYNLMNKLLEIRNQKQNIKNQIIGVMQSSSKAKEVIFYLYKNDNVRQNMIKKEINIKSTTLYDLLNKLISIRCVERLGNGSYPVYNLTIDCRRYVYENFEQFNEVRMVYQKKEMIDEETNNFFEGFEKRKLSEIDKGISLKKYVYQEFNNKIKGDYIQYGKIKETI